MLSLSLPFCLRSTLFLETVEIRFRIPSYSGIVGNETCDLLAKAAASTWVKLDIISFSESLAYIIYEFLIFLLLSTIGFLFITLSYQRFFLYPSSVHLNLTRSFIYSDYLQSRFSHKRLLSHLSDEHYDMSILSVGLITNSTILNNVLFS